MKDQKFDDITNSTAVEKGGIENQSAMKGLNKKFELEPQEGIVMTEQES